MNRRALTLLSGIALASAATAGIPVVANASHTDAVSRLTDVRAGAHTGYDRIVFEFSGKLPSSTFVDWAPRIVRDGSGAIVPAAGNAFLQIGMSGVTGLTSAHSPTVSTAPRTYALPNLANVVHAGEFEGMVSFGASFLAKTSYTVTKLTKPSRVVIDVKSVYPRTSVPVYLVDSKRVASGTTPYTRPVTRVVPTGAPAGGSLHRLFAGPTAAEHASGLRFVGSGATGFRDLTISAGVARLRLVGGCSSGGSTVTVAESITATLKAFPTVDWVKIYSPSGSTERPTGNSDSIPECLEP